MEIREIIDVEILKVHVVVVMHNLWISMYGWRGSKSKKPQTFISTSTPVEAENWISHIEKIFKVLGYDDQFNARLVAYKLEGDAHSWWMAYKLANGGNAYVATLAWNDFRDIFSYSIFNDWINRSMNGSDLYSLVRCGNSYGVYEERETIRGTKMAIVYNHHKPQYKGLVIGFMIEGAATDRATIDMSWRDQDHQVQGREYGRSYRSSSQRGN
ncbi:hypothetical protein Tco_0000882 [Tanacetum coccineum]